MQREARDPSAIVPQPFSWGRDRGCWYPAAEAVEYFDDEALFRCPAVLVDEEGWTHEFLSYWPVYHKAARYPEPGELNEQAAVYLDAMRVIDGVFGEIQERAREEADRSMAELAKNR